MAGKHAAIELNTFNQNRDGTNMANELNFGVAHPADRLYKAYAEGRQSFFDTGDSLSNPYNSAIEFFQYRAWLDGNAAADVAGQQFETGTPISP